MNRKILLPLMAIVSAGTLAAQERATITGRVVGSDGRPMAKAQVALHRFPTGRPVTSTEAAPDGSFTLSTTKTGPMTIMVSGVGHKSAEIPIAVAGPITVGVDITLGPRITRNQIDSVKIIGDFNDFDFATARPLLKQKNGTYTATFKDLHWKVFAYQLLFPGDSGRPFSMNGTQSKDYVYDGGGDYRSIVTTTDGSVTITFDPRKLPASGRGPSVAFRDSVGAALSRMVPEILRHREITETARRRHAGSRRESSGFAYDWSAEMRRLLDEARNAGAPEIRHSLLIRYLDLARLSGVRADPDVSRQILTELTPGSGLWKLEPYLAEVAIRGTGEPETFERYRWDMVESAPDTSGRTGALLNLLIRANEEHREDLAALCFEYLSSRYPASFDLKYAKAELAPNRSIKVGNKAPGFEIASLDNPLETVSGEKLRGRYYLLDFWATWCGPCVGEMENLHRAYEKFRARNFEIVSLSFDARPEKVAAFRVERWKMPWLHGFVGGSFNSELAKRFEVMAIPKPILVDANGMIVATGEELRGRTWRSRWGGYWASTEEHRPHRNLRPPYDDRRPLAMAA